MEINEMGIVEKVDFLLKVAQNGYCTDEEFSNILKLSYEHSTDKHRGKVFGYSVSDFSIATLSWLNNDRSNAEFHKIYNSLDGKRQLEIKQLINKKLYLQY